MLSHKGVAWALSVLLLGIIQNTHAEEIPAPCDACLGAAPSPICVITGGKGPTEYANPCYAVCAGVNTTRPYYLGSCSSKCNTECSAAKLKVQPATVCCKGAEYPTTCHYKCLTKAKAVDVTRYCKPGPCQGADALVLISSSKCIAGTNVTCTADPCKAAPCPGRPDTSCFANHCSRFVRYSYLGRPCSAVFIGQDGKLLREADCVCAPQGQQCVLPGARVPSAIAAMPSCCRGLTCWSGPVQQAGQVLGTCANATAPLPVGR